MTPAGEPPPCAPDTSNWQDSRARRWTQGVLLVAAVLTPLFFVPSFQDAFALPKLVVLYLLVPLGLAGPISILVLGGIPAPRRLTLPDAAALAFAVLAVAAWAVSASPRHNLQGEPLQYQGLLPLLLYSVSYALARTTFDDAAGLRRLFVWITLAGAVVGGYAVLQQLGLDPIWHALDKGRVFSTLGQADDLAAYLVLALPAAVSLVATGSRSMRVVAGIAVVLMLVALALTLSRGGYLGVVFEAMVGIALLAVLGKLRVPRPLGWRRVGQAIAAVAIVLLALIAFPPTRHGVERVVQRAASTGDLQETSIQDRLDLWAVGLRITLDNPLLGTGPDSYVLVFPAYRDTTLPPTRAAFMARFRPESPHDVYLALASGLGLPALACYLALIAGALLAAARALRSHEGQAQVLGVALVAAIVGHLVTDGFMTAELAGTWLFWVFLGAAVASSGIIDRVAVGRHAPLGVA
ncbi:MAG: O-antigen ligase family protein [Candidatus Limnocylindrales bacterium]